MPDGDQWYLLHRKKDAEVWGVEPHIKVDTIPAEVAKVLRLRRERDVLKGKDQSEVPDAVLNRQPSSEPPDEFPEDPLPDLDPQLATAINVMRMSLALEHPESVGIDRICAAAAAYDTLKRACAVASFGTAITIDCVNDEGAFLGGAILPGLGLQARALASGTAQLPDVTIQTPDVVIGNNTEEAIQIGVLYGAVGALREIVERYAEELGNWPELVITGGNADLIHEHSDIVDHHVPDLCIRGIALAHRRHYAPFTETE